MKATPAPISLAASQLCERRHVCAFFNNDEEEYRILLPFIMDGLDSGDKAVHVLNPEQRQDHLQRLASAGVDPAAAQQRGQLELRTDIEVYLPDGRFDQDRMLEVFEQLASGNAKGGFPLSRICCRMDWAVEDRSHVDDVIEFESRVNDVWLRHDDAVIDIMRTHPMVIIGGILQQNPLLCRRINSCESLVNGELAGAIRLWRLEIWMSNPYILQRRSRTFSAALMIWSVSSLFQPSGGGVSRPRLFAHCLTRCCECSSWISPMQG